MMSAVEWVVLVIAVIMIVAATHPFVTYPLSLPLIRRVTRRRALPEGAAMPEAARSVAVVSCAYNEEASLPAKLESLRALASRHPDLQVFFYSDGSTDGTDALLAAAGHPVRLVRGAGRQGKSIGINTLMEQVTSDIVIFNDANVLIDVDAVGRLLAYFEDPTIGLVSGQVTRRTKAQSASIATTASYYSLEQRLKVLESDIETTVMADGSLYAIRRPLFRPLGADMIEDAFTSASILCDGYRLVHAPDVHGVELDDTPPWLELRRKRRIAARAFRCHMALWPRLRRMSWLRLYMYLSHKFVRWLSGWLVLAAGVLLAALFLVWFPLLAAGSLLVLLALAVLVARGRMRRLDRLAAFVGAFVYTSLGVLDTLRGRSYVVWTPVRSGREAR